MATERFKPNTEYPAPCRTCSKLMVPRSWKKREPDKYAAYKSVGANGYCSADYMKLFNDRPGRNYNKALKPNHVKKPNNSGRKGFSMSHKMQFPVRCAGECGRLMRPPGTKQEEYPDTQAAHAGKGLCTKCYTRSYMQEKKAQNRPQDAQNGAQDGSEAPQAGSEGRRSPYVRDLKPELWVLEGNCLTQDPDSFFSRNEVEAKKVCQGCPVRRKCLEMAVANKEEWGVWGGVGQKTLRKIYSGKLTIDEVFNNDKRTAQKNLASIEEPQHELMGVS